MGQLLKIKAQVSSIWAKGCMFEDCMCVIWLGMTTTPRWREKVMVYFIYTYIYTGEPMSMDMHILAVMSNILFLVMASFFL